MVALAGLAGSAACRAPRVPVTVPVAVPAAGLAAELRDSVWYISARARSVGGEHPGRDTRQLADSLEHGVAIFRRAPGDDPVTGDVEQILIDSVGMTREEFVSALQRRVSETSAPYDFAAYYVHGFGTSLHEAWEHTATASARSRSPAPWIAFCWPSNGAGFTWPRASDLFARAYREDSASAQASKPAFVRATESVLAATGAAHLVLIAHSLGAQLVGDVFADSTALPAARTDGRWRAVVLLAPDVNRQRFADTLLPAITPRSARTVLYVSANDRALRVARRINGTDRAGLRAATPIMHPALETVDITDGMTADGWFQRHFGNHHTIRRASATLFDIVHIVGASTAADCRALLSTATRADDRVWHLTRATPPAPSAVAQCARYSPETLR